MASTSDPTSPGGNALGVHGGTATGSVAEGAIALADRVLDGSATITGTTPAGAFGARRSANTGSRPVPVHVQCARDRAIDVAAGMRAISSAGEVGSESEDSGGEDPGQDVGSNGGTSAQGMSDLLLPQLLLWMRLF